MRWVAESSFCFDLSVQPKTPELKLVEGEPGPGTGTCSRERASYEMTRGALYHCIMRLFAFLRPPVYTSRSCGHQPLGCPSSKCLPSQIFALARAEAGLTLSFPACILRPGPSWCQGIGRGTSHVGTWSSQHRQHHQNLVCIYTRGGNGHIWIWSLKTDRHLALWFVVISLKCDNTKRSNVTRLMLDLDTPGASVEMGWIRVGTLLILTAWTIFLLLMRRRIQFPPHNPLQQTAEWCYKKESRDFHQDLWTHQ